MSQERDQVCPHSGDTEVFHALARSGLHAASRPSAVVNRSQAPRVCKALAALSPTPYPSW
eukprot:348531-Alexandrium_andersonii.AAC.1